MHAHATDESNKMNIVNVIYLASLNWIFGHCSWFEGIQLSNDCKEQCICRNGDLNDIPIDDRGKEHDNRTVSSTSCMIRSWRGASNAIRRTQIRKREYTYSFIHFPSTVEGPLKSLPTRADFHLLWRNGAVHWKKSILRSLFSQSVEIPLSTKGR